MELISTSFHMDFSYLFLCYLAPLFLILASGIFSFKARHKNLPPGSFGWPLIGETIAFGKPEKFMLDRMNKYSPDIFKTKILGEEIAVICGPNGHKFLFTNEHKLFTPFLPYSMQKLFLSSAPGSYQLKDDIKSTRAAPGFLKPEALVKYVGKMDSITQQQMQTLWEGKDEVKAFSLAKSLTLTLACRFFMGTEDPERVARAVTRFDYIKVGMHSVPFNFPGTNFHKACKAAAAVHKELRSVISEKKAAVERGEPMQDIVSHMILATDESGKRMPEVAIADKLLGLLVAGYSTVASVMTFFMKYVGERPDIYQKVLAEQEEIAASKKPGELLEWDDMQKMKYTWKVLCEVMRITPTIQGTFREVLTDFTYAGYTVPKGWKLYWSVNSTNKNPKYFPDPQKFDPSRFDETNKLPPFTFTPFGAGPRTCPAKEYSRLAVLTFVHNVVKRFKWELVLPEEKIIGDMMPSPEQGLPIRLYSH